MNLFAGAVVMTFNKEKEIAIQSMMLREIEDYIEKDMKHMYTGLNDIKISYEEELECLDGIL